MYYLAPCCYSRCAPNACRYCVGVGSPIVWTYWASVIDWSVTPRKAQRDRPPYHNVAGVPQSQQPWLDLCIMRLEPIRIDGQPTALVPTLTLGDSDQMRTGEAIWVLGYGQQTNQVAHTQHTCPGAYAGHRDDDGTRPIPSSWIVVTCDILSGHSGGPAVNDRGEVVGWCLLSLGDRLQKGLSESCGGLHALRPINLAKPLLHASTPWTP